MDRSQYDFFAGLDGQGNAKWVKDLATGEPVFRDASGVGWNLSVSYNPGLRRYLLITEHTKSGRGNFGLFDAPEPWGPWTTVHYISAFGASYIEASTFFWNFSNKWLSPDGKEFVLIFTGIDENDSWNLVTGSFVVFDRSARMVRAHADNYEPGTEPIFRLLTRPPMHEDDSRAFGVPLSSVAPQS
jgi:hypothetical protein